MKGIGAKIHAKIVEILSTGKLEAAEKAKEKAMQMFLSKIGYAPKIQLTESGPFDKTF